MSEIKRLHELSGVLAAIVRDHPEEQPEERFYLCPINLARKIEPETCLRAPGFEEEINALCSAGGNRTKIRDHHGKLVWPYVGIRGSEAEERWPTLILASQLWPIHAHSLGVETATWSEMRWGAQMRGKKDAENPERSPDMLQMLQWRARWSPPGWRRAKEDICSLREAYLIEFNDPHKHQNRLFRDIDLLIPLIDAQHGSTDRANIWLEQDWLDLGWFVLLRRSGIKEKQLEGELSDLPEIVRSAGTEPTGHWESDEGRSALSLAWAPFPSLGPNITLIAFDKENTATTVALIRQEPTAERTKP